MYVLKRSSTAKLNLKDLRFVNGQIVNEENEPINLVQLLENAFGVDFFTISAKMQIDDQQDVDDEVSEDAEETDA